MAAVTLKKNHKVAKDCEVFHILKHTNTHNKPCQLFHKLHYKKLAYVSKTTAKVKKQQTEILEVIGRKK